MLLSGHSIISARPLLLYLKVILWSHLLCTLWHDSTIKTLLCFFFILLQECYLALAKHQNVHLLQVERLVQGGGPWANPTVQGILSESSLPQNDGQ